MERERQKLVSMILVLGAVLTALTSFTTAFIILNCIIYFKTRHNLRYYTNSYKNTLGFGDYYRLVTSGFAHAGILHLLCNMYSLYNIAPFLEGIYNKFTVMFVYLLIMILTAFLSCKVNRNIGKSDVESLGASGAICGLFGIVLLLHYDVYGMQGITAFIPTLILLFLMSFNKQIDSYSHFIGLILGMVAGALLA